MRACTSSVSITIEAPRPNDQAPKSDTTNPRSIPSNSGASLDWCAISCEPDVLAGDRAIDPLLSVRCRCRCCSFAAPRKHPHASTHRSSHHLSIDPSNHVLSLSLSLSLSLLLATDSSDRHPSLRRRGHVIDPLLPLRISILALSRSRSSSRSRSLPRSPIEPRQLPCGSTPRSSAPRPRWWWPMAGAPSAATTTS